jgi:hypothetical protein
MDKREAEAIRKSAEKEIEVIGIDQKLNKKKSEVIGSTEKLMKMSRN